MYEIDGYEVLTVEQVDTGNQIATVCRHYAFTKKLVVSGSLNALINTDTPFNAKWQDWQGNDLPEELSNIVITVTGPAQLTEFTLNPVNGQANFDLVFPVAGAYEIQVSAEFPCDTEKLGVTVNE